MKSVHLAVTFARNCVCLPFFFPFTCTLPQQQKKDQKDKESFNYITRRLDTNPGVDIPMVLSALRNEAILGISAYIALTKFFPASSLPFQIEPTWYNLLYAATAAVPLIVGSWFLSRSKSTGSACMYTVKADLEIVYVNSTCWWFQQSSAKQVLVIVYLWM
jgi:hypothetical protein